MLNSVNTNTGAMIALQNLGATGRALQTTQDRINTGLKVSSAKDNGAIWAIAQNMRANVSSLDAVKSSLNSASSSVDVAVYAGEAVSDLLNQMKAKAVSASDKTLDANAFSALNEDFKALRDQIMRAVDSAEFNGTNLVKSGGSTITALGSADASTVVTVAAQDLSVTGSNIGFASATTDLGSSASTASAMVTTLTTAISNVSAAVAKLGTGSNALQNHLTFVGKLQDTLTGGVGNLVDADLAKESASLQALQTKQQLGVQALSIANSQPNSLLKLFG